MTRKLANAFRNSIIRPHNNAPSARNLSLIKIRLDYYPSLPSHLAFSFHKCPSHFLSNTRRNNHYVMASTARIIATASGISATTTRTQINRSLYAPLATSGHVSNHGRNQRWISFPGQQTLGVLQKRHATVFTTSRDHEHRKAQTFWSQEVRSFQGRKYFTTTSRGFNADKQESGKVTTR